jgi:hypothetical protein
MFPMKIFLGNQFNGKYKMLYDFNQNRRERDRPFPWKPAVLKKNKKGPIKVCSSVRSAVWSVRSTVLVSSVRRYVGRRPKPALPWLQRPFRRVAAHPVPSHDGSPSAGGTPSANSYIDCLL